MITERECHRTYCHGNIYRYKVIFYLGLQMMWNLWYGQKRCTLTKYAHLNNLNHDFCDTWKCSRNHTQLKCISYVDLGDRMINSFTVCQIWKWTKSCFSFGDDNSQHRSHLSFMWYYSHLETCDLSSCVTYWKGW